MNLDTWNMSVAVPRVEVHLSVSEFLCKRNSSVSHFEEERVQVEARPNRL